MGDLTVVQKKEMLKGAQAMGAIAGRFAKRKSDRLVSPLSELSFWGKTLAILAAAAALAFAALVIFNASHVKVDQTQIATVARDTVNVRSAPSIKAGIEVKAHSGDRFNVVTTSGKWTRVRSSNGRTGGWIASSLLNTGTTKTMTYQYEMRGYVIYFIVALMVMFFALRMRKAPEAAKARGSETLLMNNKS